MCGSTNGTGIFSQVSAGSGQTTAGYFQSDSTGGTGAVGWASALSGTTTGVYGECISPNGTGVLGEYFATTGAPYGVRGKVAASSGRAVYGETTNTTGTSFGVYGTTPSTAGRGVYGEATTTTAGALPYGVRGSCNLITNGYALYAAGDTGASGTKSFRIDHPLDPANKYLLHYSSESPYPQNFYNGNVTTDGKGYAWVQLPDYFDEVNSNFKYVLTVLDDRDSNEFVQAKVSKKIRDNRFQIRTSVPNVEVSWRVDADRNDLYCRFKKPKSEVNKVGEEIGKYQHPMLYNKPESLGMDYHPNR